MDNGKHRRMVAVLIAAEQGARVGPSAGGRYVNIRELLCGAGLTAPVRMPQRRQLGLLLCLLKVIREHVQTHCLGRITRVGE